MGFGDVFAYAPPVFCSEVAPWMLASEPLEVEATFAFYFVAPVEVGYQVVLDLVGIFAEVAMVRLVLVQLINVIVVFLLGLENGWT